jgi:hypothetical protein
VHQCGFGPKGYKPPNRPGPKAVEPCSPAVHAIAQLSDT